MGNTSSTSSKSPPPEPKLASPGSRSSSTLSIQTNKDEMDKFKRKALLGG